MKRVVVSALLVFGLGVGLACAQRGGSRGGFSGHAASGFHGSVGSAGRSGFAAAPRFSGGGFARPMPVRGPGFSGGRGPVGRRPVNRVPYARGRSVFALSPWVGPGYVGYPYGFGYPDSSFDTDANDAQTYGAQPEYPQQPSYPEYGVAPEPPIPYVEQTPPPQRVAAPLPAEDAVTIVFKDGRAPLEVHNYVLTRTTLFVRDQRHRDIPVSDVDVAATVKANHDAGVDFQVPAMK